MKTLATTLAKTLHELTQDDAFWAKRELEIKAYEAEQKRKKAEAAAAKRIERWLQIPKIYREPFEPAKSPIPPDVFAEVRRWTPESGRGIGLLGASGMGKTRLLVRLLHRLECTWLFVPATRYAAAVREQYDHDHFTANRAFELLRDCRTVQVLLLDDIGQESPTEAVSEAMFDLIEYRTARKKAVLWTGNFTADELRTRHKTRGAAIVRRLQEFTWSP